MGQKGGLNLIMHIMVIKYGEKAGKIWFNRSDKMEISKSDIFFAHPLPPKTKQKRKKKKRNDKQQIRNNKLQRNKWQMKIKTPLYK